MIGKAVFAARYGITYKTLLRLLIEKGVCLKASKNRKYLTPLEVQCILDAIGSPSVL